MIINKPPATVSVGTQFDDSHASVDKVVEKMHNCEQPMQSDTAYQREPAMCENSLDRIQARNIPMIPTYRINVITQDHPKPQFYNESLHNTKDNHKGIKVGELVNRDTQNVPSDVDKEVVFDTEMENDLHSIKNIPLRDIVRTHTPNQVNEDISNTKLETNQGIACDKELSDSQIILRYIHKKFGQRDLKRKDTLEEPSEKDVDTTRVNFIERKR